jgi:hypothetical protein
MQMIVQTKQDRNAMTRPMLSQTRKLFPQTKYPQMSVVGKRLHRNLVNP